MGERRSKRRGKKRCQKKKNMPFFILENPIPMTGVPPALDLLLPGLRLSSWGRRGEEGGGGARTGRLLQRDYCIRAEAHPTRVKWLREREGERGRRREREKEREGGGERGRRRDREKER